MFVVLLEGRAVSGTRVLADKVSTSDVEVTYENAPGSATVRELGGDEIMADDDDGKSKDDDCDTKDEDNSALADKGAKTGEVSDKLCCIAIPKLFCCVNASGSLFESNEEFGDAETVPVVRTGREEAGFDTVT